MSNSILNVTAVTADSDIQEAVELASPAERVTAYNAATGKEIKKFSSKAAGIAQTVKALKAQRDALAAEQTTDEEAAPEPTEEPTEEAAPEPTEEAAPEPTEEPTEEAAPEPTTGRDPSKHSAAVAATWDDPEVRAKRAQRNGCEVDGTYYNSVRAAYLALGLPLKEHIQFRMQLKELGEADNHGYHWKIVPRRKAGGEEE